MRVPKGNDIICIVSTRRATCWLTTLEPCSLRENEVRSQTRFPVCVTGMLRGRADFAIRHRILDRIHRRIRFAGRQSEAGNGDQSHDSQETRRQRVYRSVREAMSRKISIVSPGISSPAYVFWHWKQAEITTTNYENGKEVRSQA
jgi:hypothetical protein